jgi:hypothetical protein
MGEQTVRKGKTKSLEDPLFLLHSQYQSYTERLAIELVW